MVNRKRFFVFHTLSQFYLFWKWLPDRFPNARTRSLLWNLIQLWKENGFANYVLHFLGKLGHLCPRGKREKSVEAVGCSSFWRGVWCLMLKLTGWTSPIRGNYAPNIDFYQCKPLKSNIYYCENKIKKNIFLLPNDNTKQYNTIIVCWCLQQLAHKIR